MGTKLPVFFPKWMPNSVMLAKGCDPEKLEYPVAVEDKLDGLRVWFLNGKGYTRQGHSYETFTPFAKVFLEVVGSGVVVDTELCGATWNITSSLVKRQKDIDEKAIKDLITCYVFDVFSEATINKARYDFRRIVVLDVVSRAKGIGDDYSIVSTTKVIAKNAEDIQKALVKALAKKKEGIVVKRLGGVYAVNPKRRENRTDDWQKVKPFKDITVKIVGSVEQQGKCPSCTLKKSRTVKPENCFFCGGSQKIIKKGLLGAFICETSMGARVDVGGGFTDEMRKQFWKDRKGLLGEKIDVKVQDDANNDIVARHPVFMKFRND